MNSETHDALMYARELMSTLSADSDDDSYVQGVNDCREIVYQIIKENI